jgi:dipeptidyl aminopeptidase/acylaminoacyl peptidase
VAGGPKESISQPRWSPDGLLHWVSDRTGWWNLYAEDDGEGRALLPMDAEFTGPDWVFGQSTYGFRADGHLVVTWLRNALARMGVLQPGGGDVEPWDVPYTAIGSLRPYGDRVVAVAASATEEPAVVVLDGDGHVTDTLRRSRPSPVDSGYVSAARPVEFATEGGRTAHALWYPPANKDAEGPADERPPLIVTIHGGPTASASPALSLATQFWTSRGFAVIDVNYGGSTGYGREYRQRLRGQWGVVDVDDCVNAARHLASEGLVDGSRVAIRGGSAGGYTTLCALTFRDEFAAGASYYGVADAEALAADTHKFESRYLDGLIGPYPEAADLYRARSPIHFPDRLSAPLILFQGLEDKVVPPAQAEVMVDALRRRGLPFAYVAFEGEQHGFRTAETIVRAIEGELWFYGKVLGFEPADDIEAVAAENLA